MYVSLAMVLVVNYCRLWNNRLDGWGIVNCGWKPEA